MIGCLSSELNVYTDDLVFEGIKEKSHARRHGNNFKTIMKKHMKNLRPVCKQKRSFCHFLDICKTTKDMPLQLCGPSVQVDGELSVQGEVWVCLQKHPRITSLLKSYDTDVKKEAAVFSQEEVDSFIKSKLITTLYWLVR